MGCSDSLRRARGWLGLSGGGEPDPVDFEGGQAEAPAAWSACREACALGLLLLQHALAIGGALLALWLAQLVLRGLFLTHQGMQRDEHEMKFSRVLLLSRYACAGQEDKNSTVCIHCPSVFNRTKALLQPAAAAAAEAYDTLLEGDGFPLDFVPLDALFSRESWTALQLLLLSAHARAGDLAGLLLLLAAVALVGLAPARAVRQISAARRGSLVRRDFFAARAAAGSCCSSSVTHCHSSVTVDASGSTSATACYTREQHSYAGDLAAQARDALLQSGAAEESESFARASLPPRAGLAASDAFAQASRDDGYRLGDAFAPPVGGGDQPFAAFGRAPSMFDDHNPRPPLHTATRTPLDYRSRLGEAGLAQRKGVRV